MSESLLPPPAFRAKPLFKMLSWRYFSTFQPLLVFWWSVPLSAISRVKHHVFYFFVSHITYQGFQHRVSVYYLVAANRNVISISLNLHWMIILAMLALAATTEIPPNSVPWHSTSLFLILFTPLCWCLFSTLWIGDPSSFYLVDHWSLIHGFQSCPGSGLSSRQLEGAKGWRTRCASCL